MTDHNDGGLCPGGKNCIGIPRAEAAERERDIVARDAGGGYMHRKICAERDAALARAEAAETSRGEAWAFFYNGCLTGDCPHEAQAECDTALLLALKDAGGDAPPNARAEKAEGRTERAKEALRFYADHANWYDARERLKKKTLFKTAIFDDFETMCIMGINLQSGGKRARQALIDLGDKTK